jgi:hypothetical protein
LEMRRQYIRLFPLVLAASLLLAPGAHAQEITVFAGGLLPGNIQIEDVPTSLDNSPIYGVRLATGFAGPLKLEHSFALSHDFLFPSGQPGVIGAKGIILNSNLLVNIPAGKIVPYATAGLGFISQWGSDNLPVGTKFAINYGGGVKFRKLAGPVGLRIDARGYTAINVFSHAFNMFEISGGLLLSF